MSITDVLDAIDALNFIMGQKNAVREMSEDEYDDPE